MNPEKTLTDGQLVLACRSGDRSAMVQLVKRWHRPFCKKAFYVVKDVDIAKDIAQDSWQVILKKLGTLNDPERFSGWALRIVQFKAIDHLRKGRRLFQPFDANKIDHQVEEEPYEENTQLKAELYKAILELPVHQQHVVRLFYLEQRSLREIGKLLDISPGTVKSRLYHARETLKKTLKHRNYEN